MTPVKVLSEVNAFSVMIGWGKALMGFQSSFAILIEG